MRPFEPALLRLVPASRTPVVALSVVGVLGGAVAVAQAVCLAWLASAVVTGGALAVPLGWTVGLLVGRGLIAGVQQWLAGWAGQRVAGGVRLRLLRRWSGRPEGARPEADEMVRRATDGVAGVEPYVARYLPALVTAAFVPAASLVTLAFIDVWSALIVALTLPLLPVFAALIGQHTRDETQRRWAAMSDLAGHFLDVVRGLPTLVNYGRAERQTDVVAEVGRRHRLATVRTLRTAFLSTVALELLATISVALVAVNVGLRLAYGAMELPVAMAAILLAPEAYWPIRRVGSEFHNAADGAEALERLLPDLEPADPARRTASRVVVEGLSYHHPGRSDTLRDLDLATEVGPGLTAVTGASGAGKTTLLELVAGLRLPNSGRVDAPRAHLATQRPVLLPGTVGQNLALVAPDASDDDLREALQQVGLWAALAERQGLATRLGDDGFGLSAGQRSRLALARALLSDAPLVLLDEPTAHIAPHALPDLRARVVALAAERRVVVATHDLDLAALADERWQVPLLDAAGAPMPAADVAPAARAGVSPGRVPQRPGLLHRWLPSARVRLALAAVVGGLATASGVALTATSGWLIVQASYQPVVLTLLVAIVGVRAFGLARPVLRYAERVISHDVALGVLADERTRTYARLIPLTPARLGRRSRGDVLTAIVRDLDDVTDEKVRVVVPVWEAALASVVAAAVVGVFVPAAGVIVACAAALALALGRLDQAVEQRAHDRLVAARGLVRRLTTLVCSQMTGVQALTGLGPSEAVVGRVAAAQASEDAAARALSRARGVALGLTWLVIAASVAGVALLAAAAFGAGALDGPTAALVALTPMALADTWAALPDAFGARARARAARARLRALLAQEPAVAQPAGPASGVPAGGVPALTVEQVEARWQSAADRAPDLAATDLTVAPGEQVVLTGPNGVGKSTLLAVLARHLDASAGRYRHDATDVREVPLADVRARLAIVDDEPHAFAGTVRANLELARPGASDAEIVAALGAADLGHWLRHLPGGLDTPLTGLSGGERTRLSVARALLSGRPVLLLDEPTAHLDVATAQRVLGTLGHGARSTVMVSHDMAPDGWRRVDLARRGALVTSP